MPPEARGDTAWAPLPQAYGDMGSLEFSKLLLEQAEVAVAPGIGFGEHGEGYVRIALVENEHRIRQAARNIKRFLLGSDARQDHGQSALAGADVESESAVGN